LSDYLRHSFRDHGSAITMEEEIAQCENYINLIGISAYYPPIFSCDVDESTFGFPVPAVSILTLVENAIKHTPSGQRSVKISLVARSLVIEGTGYINIAVRDDGQGFSEDMLHLLNNMDWDEDREDHVGLRNVIKRFQLMYGENTHISFYNNQGAVVELFVPVGRTSRGSQDGGNKT